MALPPGFLDELRNRLTLSEVVGERVVWDRRKSAPARGDWWAPCPFHQEKTPSFHVDDGKGFYYCFGCHAKGDAITFAMEIDGLGFMEAVERLSGQAGLEMPKERDDPAAKARRDRREVLLDAMEQANAAFARAFRSAAGARARDYAERRGLTAETLKRFEIGFAPDSRRHLAEIFAQAGATDAAVEAGLLIRPDSGGQPYDRFRDRLMFPIRDARGRLIAFGGRALSADAMAKYLNSPETPLFHKGRTLYNIGPARTAAQTARRLVVAEGYMDVIALAQAGIAEALAPLGTAITEDQLALLWKIAPEPVVALDGDTAGLRAAHRLIDLALPLIGPGRTLSFSLMPAGKDPDDLIKAGGVAAMEEALGAALPLVELLWRREAETGPADTPERRADLARRLDQTAGRIADQGLRRYYEDALRRRLREHLWALDRPQRFAGSGGSTGRGGRAGPFQRQGRAADGASLSAKTSALARARDERAVVRAREATILLIALRHPDAARAHLETIEALPLAEPDLAAARDRLVRLLDADATEADEMDALSRTLSAEPAAAAHPLNRPGARAEQAGLVIGEMAEIIAARHWRDTERRETGPEIAEATDEAWTARMGTAALSPEATARRALKLEEEAEERAADGQSRISRLYEDYRHRNTTDAKKN